MKKNKNLTYFATGIMPLLAVLFYVACKKNNETLTPKKKIPPIDNIAYLHMADMNQYLDGEQVDLAELDTSNSQFAIYNHEYDSTSIYTFSSLAAMENWLSGLPFEDQILRQNHLCDSMSEIVDENDTNSYDWNLFVTKPKLGNTKLFKHALGGFKFWDGPPASGPPTQIPPPGTGAHRYFWGKNINFDDWNNRATTFHIYGIGSQIFCSKKKFMGRRFFNIVFGVYGHSLLGTTWDNNIMSTF